MKRFQIVVGAALLLGTSQVRAWEGQDLRQDYCGDPITEINQLREAGSDFNFAALPTFSTIVDPEETLAQQLEEQHKVI